MEPIGTVELLYAVTQRTALSHTQDAALHPVVASIVPLCDHGAMEWLTRGPRLISLTLNPCCVSAASVIVLLNKPTDRAVEKRTDLAVPIIRGDSCISLSLVFLVRRFLSQTDHGKLNSAQRNQGDCLDDSDQ